MGTSCHTNVKHTVDGSEIRLTTGMVLKPCKICKNNGISTTNLNWWTPDFWTINSIKLPRKTPRIPNKQNFRDPSKLKLSNYPHENNQEMEPEKREVKKNGTHLDVPGRKLLKG